MSAGYASRLSEYHNKGKVGLPESFDSQRSLHIKLKRLTEWVDQAQHLVVLTGAGISTSAGIPDFRGPKGIWTLEQQQKKRKKKQQQQRQPKVRNNGGNKRKRDDDDDDDDNNNNNDDASMDFSKARPTLTHRAITKLVSVGKLKYCATQNVDGLHRRAGLSRDYHSALHGCAFTEKCHTCQTEYFRDHDVGGMSFQPTGNQCQNCQRGDLHDTLLDWEDALPEDDLQKAEQEFEKADLVLCLGTSLRIEPVGSLPLLAKRFVIVNLQVTPKDDQASLIVKASVDDVMDYLMEHLGHRDWKNEIPPPIERIWRRRTSPSKLTQQPLHGRVYCVAVGGGEESRRKRANEASSLFPLLEHSYLIGKSTIDPFPFPIQDNVGLSLHPPPSNTTTTTPTTTSTTVTVVRERFTLACTPNDTLLVLGQCGFHETTVQHVFQDLDQPTVWLQGPGFNVLPEHLSILTHKAGKLNLFRSDDCPSFTAEEWNQLFESNNKQQTRTKNKERLNTLRCLALAQFWLTRSDSSFHSFASLWDIDQLALERNVAYDMGWNDLVAIADDTEKEFVPFTQAQHGTDAQRVLKKNNNNGNSKIQGGKWFHLLKAWNQRGKDVMAMVSPSRDRILLALSQVLKNHLRNTSQKDYDGYVMRRALLGSKVPPESLHEDGRRHYKILQSLLINDQPPPEAYVEGLARMLTQGDVYVLHDLGLDGNVDDAIALVQLHGAYKELMTKNSQCNNGHQAHSLC